MIISYVMQKNHYVMQKNNTYEESKSKKATRRKQHEESKSKKATRRFHTLISSMLINTAS